MNRLRATAVALVGWYLMTPPVASCRGGTFAHPCGATAISKWTIERRFDEAAKCETAKAAWHESGMRYSTRRDHAGPQRLSPEEADFARWLLAECVPNDDPRLKQK
jgi:hypothetical protein